MGGSDHWGNILNGIELSRCADGTEVMWRHHPAGTPRRMAARWARPCRAPSGSMPISSRISITAPWQQHRRSRRRPLPAPVHRPAARRDRPLEAPRRRDRRGAKKVPPTKHRDVLAVVLLPRKRAETAHARCSIARLMVRCPPSRSRAAISPWSTARRARPLPSKGEACCKIAEAIHVDEQGQRPALEIAGGCADQAQLRQEA